MHGLRFDSQRETNLKRSHTASSSFTYSCWVKRTDGTDFHLFSADSGVDNQSNYSCFEYRENLKIYVTDVVNSSGNLISTATFPANIWHNFVFSFDGTDITVYANGKTEMSGAYSATEFKKKGVHAIGAVGSTSASLIDIFADGYLSDVYFVDGQALDAEAFGKSFDGKWGPLDSSEVTANINVNGGSFGANGFYLPFDPAAGIGADASGQGNNFADENFNVFDDAADEIATWSDYWDNPPNASSNRPPYDSFDGDITTFTGCERSETNQWIPPGGLTVNNSITIWTNAGSGSRNAEEEIEFIFNDATYQRTQIKDESETIENSVRKWTRTVDSPVTLQKISQNRGDGGNGICMSRLQIDGKDFIDDQYIATVGVDTVLDTPMDNYAVLETGKNGNLVATANGTNLTYVGEAGTDYYYEADGEADIHAGGSAFSSTNGKVYNFGQQPFAVELDDSRDWSGDFTTGTYDANLPASNSFNGIIASGQIVDASYSTGASGQTAGFDFTSIPGGGISFTKSLQLYVFRNT